MALKRVKKKDNDVGLDPILAGPPKDAEARSATRGSSEPFDVEAEEETARRSGFSAFPRAQSTYWLARSFIYRSMGFV